MMRRTFERLCRLVAFGAVLAALLLSWRAGDGHAASPARAVSLRLPASVLADSAAALAPLQRWLVARGARLPRGNGAAVGTVAGIGDEGRGDTLVLPLPVIPSAAVRAALGSMRASGIPVRWLDGTRAEGLAASVTRAGVPGAPVEVRATVRRRGATSPSLTLRDAGGLLDSLGAAGTGAVASWRLASAAPPLRVQAGQSTVPLELPDSVRVRRVLVMAQPGWEGKFVVAALEESGWLVDGTLRVSPSGAVTIGDPQRLDITRYAAVVVLDSMPVDASALTRFAMRGGGVVLGGEALRLPSLRSLIPGRASVLRGAIAGALLTDTPRRGLEAWEFDPADDAVILEVDRGEHEHDEPALVARRSGAGRVVAIPYRETWRWRMQGSDDGMPAHRRWWHDAVSAAIGWGTDRAVVAESGVDRYPGHGAPYADLVARVGSADAAPVVDGPAVSPQVTGGVPSARDSGDSVPVPPWLVLSAALLALLAEWASRRLRGAR